MWRIVAKWERFSMRGIIGFEEGLGLLLDG